MSDFKISDISMVSVKHSSKKIERTINKKTLHDVWDTIKKWHTVHVNDSDQQFQQYDIIVVLEKDNVMEAKAVKMNWVSRNDLGEVDFVDFVDFVENLSYSLNINTKVKTNVVISKISNCLIMRRKIKGEIKTHYVSDNVSYNTPKNYSAFYQVVAFQDWEYYYVSDNKDAFYSSMSIPEIANFLLKNLLNNKLHELFYLEVLNDFISEYPSAFDSEENSNIWAQISVYLNNTVANSAQSVLLLQILARTYMKSVDVSKKTVIMHILVTYAENLRKCLSLTDSILKSIELSESLI